MPPKSPNPPRPERPCRTPFRHVLEDWLDHFERDYASPPHDLPDLGRPHHFDADDGDSDLDDGPFNL